VELQDALVGPPEKLRGPHPWPFSLGVRPSLSFGCSARWTVAVEPCRRPEFEVPPKDGTCRDTEASYLLFELSL